MAWTDLIRDLARLQAVIVDLDGTCHRLRTDCVGHAAMAFQAARLPPSSAPPPDLKPPPADPAAALLTYM